ncbi:MAG TPA: HAD-IIIC family phosphatase [Polyangiaceae bacterium]
METGHELRRQVDDFLAAGEWKRSYLVLGELWRTEQTAATASFINRCRDRLAPHLTLASRRVAFLRSFTVEPMVALLRAAALMQGIDLVVHVGDFNAYAQEMIDPASPMYDFAPDIVVVAVRIADVSSRLWDAFPGDSPDVVVKEIDRLSDTIAGWIAAVRARSSASIIVHSFEMPAWPRQGILDAQSEAGQLAALSELNRRLRALAARTTGVYVLDYDALVARHGREQWHDERKWQTMRMPITAKNHLHLAHEWLRMLVPLSGKGCKVLVTDLDNTLWGGVIGEDGMAGIHVGADAKGAGFRALQRAMLDVRQRGIILAICSKNNQADIDEVFEQHPDMLLRLHHFSSMRINWADKPTNLAEISAELNLGTDALAFLDDNPVERHRVREEMPEVTVIDLPSDPMAYAQALQECFAFERLHVSQEDKERTRHYADERHQTVLRNHASSLEDFFRSLEQNIIIKPLCAENIPRVAQLTQKTNQFNVTTRRYSEQELAALAGRLGHCVLTVTVHDRFGDSGLVGMVITRDDVTGEASEIDNFLLSCRVIGRTVETALLAYVTEQARQAGKRELRGWFYPTRKNAPAADFYEKHGFARREDVESGSLWSLDVTAAMVPYPLWSRIVTPDGERP